MAGLAGLAHGTELGLDRLSVATGGHLCELAALSLQGLVLLREIVPAQPDVDACVRLALIGALRETGKQIEPGGIGEILGVVRERLLGLQRGFLKAPGLVADGRDMGTVVFPDARFKFFLYASPEIRAQRRYKQLINMGLSANIAQLQADIAERDERDQKRDVSPLVPAEDALVVESSLLDLAQVTELVLSHIREKQ